MPWEVTVHGLHHYQLSRSDLSRLIEVRKPNVGITTTQQLVITKHKLIIFQTVRDCQSPSESLIESTLLHSSRKAINCKFINKRAPSSVNCIYASKLTGIDSSTLDTFQCFNREMPFRQNQEKSAQLEHNNICKS